MSKKRTNHNTLKFWVEARYIHKTPEHIVCFRLPGKKVFSHFVVKEKEAIEWELHMREKEKAQNENKQSTDKKVTRKS